jgi:hypothetical protein
MTCTGDLFVHRCIIPAHLPLLLDTPRVAAGISSKLSFVIEGFKADEHELNLILQLHSMAV